MIVHYIESYSSLSDNHTTREQLSLQNGSINLEKIELSSIYSRREKILPYIGYENFITNPTYWTIKNKVITNCKPIVFKPNEESRHTRIDTIIIYNNFGTIRIDCRLRKKLYLPINETIGFHERGIYVVVK